MRRHFRYHLVLLLFATCIVVGCPPSPPTGGEGLGEGAAEGEGEIGLQDAAGRFFVDAAVGDDTNSGVRDAPLATIQEAINRAAVDGGEVVVAAGSYAGSIELASAVDVLGGYDPSTWLRDIDQFQSIIEGGTTAVRGSRVMNVQLEGLTVIAADATGQLKGAVATSSIVIQCFGSSDFAIRDCMLVAGNGAAGLGGARGLDGGNGVAGVDGAAAVACGGTIPGGDGGQDSNAPDCVVWGGEGGAGNVGDGTAGASSGCTRSDTPGGAGGTVGLDGTAGECGASGEDGTPGLGGSDVGTASDTGYLPARGILGQNGSGGFGGGGGGGGGGAIVFACGGSGGGGGGGGIAGTRGMAGEGGGASIGVLLVSSMNIELDGNVIVTANGGSGGSGGAAGLGGSGAAGGTGGARFGGQGAGGRGGSGGDGGNGGPGGGGGGGPSIAILENALTELVLVTNNEFMLGQGGVGGAASGGENSAGADGLVAETFKLD